jgi:hypothetical protein
VQLADTAPAASLIGAMATMLSVTGIMVCTKKRSARLHHRARGG